MARMIYGTTTVPGMQHPVFDIRLWQRRFPLKKNECASGTWVDNPGKLAQREQAIRRARSAGDLGPCVASDVFVWANTEIEDRPWLTRIGGTPWRPKGKAWPQDDNGVPMAFLGQICFADSMDILPCKLPGEVALFFGSNDRGSVSTIFGAALEWSPLKIKKPETVHGVPPGGGLVIRYQGVRHRTVQYTDEKSADMAFHGAGYEGGGFGLYSIQATSIGSHAHLPQGWPFQVGDGNTLIATLSSFYFRGKWPLCDIPRGLKRVHPDGREVDLEFDDPRDFSIGDAGCIWIYRDKTGSFKLGDACA